MQTPENCGPLRIVTRRKKPGELLLHRCPQLPSKQEGLGQLIDDADAEQIFSLIKIRKCV